MTRGEARWNHAANVLVGGTGLVYGWMLYFGEPVDDFALVNHPLQPDLQAWHVRLAPLLVFTVALIWAPHVWKRVRSGFRPRRATGLTLCASFWPMVASGYLLQTAVSEGWRLAWVVVHVATSILWLVFYGVHLLRPRPARGAPA